MTEAHDEHDAKSTSGTMERDLQSITRYDGKPTKLWKHALEQVEAEDADGGGDGANAKKHRHWRFMNRPIAPKVWLNCGLAAAALVILVGVLIPSPLKERSGQGMAMNVISSEDAKVSTGTELLRRREFSLNYASPDTVSKNFSVLLSEQAFQFDIEGDSRPSSSSLFRQPAYQQGDGFDEEPDMLRGTYNDLSRNTLRQSETPQDATRSIIRNVTMEIRTPDVAATFLRARQLVSRAGGEFIEDSSLTGEGDAARANLTLRIAPDRLSDVLNELRTLGVVASEQARSEDVTNQVVDLEARLRNEQRVEQELLELLESRVDADLSEILKLQSEIGRVRTNIERFIAQRDRLSRLVSLATVLVIIRPQVIEPVIEKPKEATMWDDFKGSINDSWEGGVAFLSNTIAGLLGILVGGFVWWIALIAVALMVRRYVRTLPEPAP